MDGQRGQETNSQPQQETNSQPQWETDQESNYPASYERLESLRLLEKFKISEDKMFSVNRNKIMNDFFSAYQSVEDPSQFRFRFIFNEEDAVGDGVTREAYTCFYEEFYKFCNGNIEGGL
eukprot:TCONS_00037962-protein